MGVFSMPKHTIITFEVCVGIGCGAGWVTSYRGSPAVSFGPENSRVWRISTDAAALVEPMAISHWSALARYGLTTQIPPMVQASTPRTIVTPEMRAGQAHRPRGTRCLASTGDGV